MIQLLYLYLTRPEKDPSRRGTTGKNSCLVAVYSHSVSLHPGVQVSTGKMNARGNLAMDYHPSKGDQQYLHVHLSKVSSLYLHAEETRISSGLMFHLASIKT